MGAVTSEPYVMMTVRMMEQFGVRVESKEEDPMTTAVGDGRLIAERTVGQLRGCRKILAAHLPKIVAAIVGGLKDECLAIRSPRSTALCRGTAPPF